MTDLTIEVEELARRLSCAFGDAVESHRLYIERRDWDKLPEPVRDIWRRVAKVAINCIYGKVG